MAEKGRENFIKAAMDRAGIRTFLELERLTGLSHSCCWRIRNGADCRVSTLRRLAKVLGITAAELLDGQQPDLCQQVEREPNTSLEFVRHANGQYGWGMKIAFSLLAPAEINETISRLKAINETLKGFFSDD